MKKKISVGASIVLVLLAVLLTFQVTFTVMSVKHREEMVAAYGRLAYFDKLLEEWNSRAGQADLAALPSASSTNRKRLSRNIGS